MRIGSKLAALAAAVCLTTLTGSVNAADITVVATGGPLPEVITDMLAAQRKMREQIHEVHRQYRRDLVPLKQAVVLFEGRSR